MTITMIKLDFNNETNDLYGQIEVYVGTPSFFQDGERLPPVV